MSEADPLREPDQLEGVPLPEFRTEVIGHREARGKIMAALDGIRIPGGILLHGPRGIGKATLAFDIAREIFARTGDETNSHIAAQVASGGYPNLRVLRRVARETGKGFYTAIRVDEVRSLIGDARMTRGRAGFRIIVVDAIDDCNTSSANALLKVLEEPPSDTLFLLVSHRPGSLLPTIKSRCQSIALRPLDDDDMRKVVGDGPEAQAAIALAGGRPRRAYEALALGGNKALSGLDLWLAAPHRGQAGIYLGLAEELASEKDGTVFSFSRQKLLDWLAAEARQAAVDGARARLASANELWDKANAAFADVEILNLDARQTLVSIFDTIRRHAESHLSPIEAR